MEQAATISVSSLALDHLDPFVRSLRNLLSTDLAEFVFAQIVDGLPADDTVGYQPPYNAKIRNNPAPSAEAIAAVKQFRDLFNATSLELDLKKIQAFQKATPDSSEFNFRLLELVAVACHDIAALLYNNTQPGIRKDMQDPEQRAALLGSRETNFMVYPYSEWQHYPKGVADMVGYWAEYHLFGGVVLFDRGDLGNECKSVFLHPVAGFMIFQLSNAQISQFVAYGQHETANTIPHPFPFRAEKYANRIDDFDAMALNIYRDKYERSVPKERPERCVRRAEDDPYFWDQIQDILSKHDEK